MFFKGDRWRGFLFLFPLHLSTVFLHLSLFLFVGYFCLNLLYKITFSFS
jgi:hypothetical protein